MSLPRMTLGRCKGALHATEESHDHWLRDPPLTLSRSGVLREADVRRTLFFRPVNCDRPKHEPLIINFLESYYC